MRCSSYTIHTETDNYIEKPHTHQSCERLFKKTPISGIEHEHANPAQINQNCTKFQRAKHAHMDLQSANEIAARFNLFNQICTRSIFAF